uniref:Uncharacterized protein n=1 Tax=Plectus sambesii TaxID=2011161 RepID=A0A914WVD9_9BILA
MPRCFIWATAAVLFARGAALDDPNKNMANMRVKVTKYGLDYANK